MIIQAELKCKQTGCEADPCAVDSGADLPLTYKDTQSAFVNQRTEKIFKKAGKPCHETELPSFSCSFFSRFDTAILEMP